MKTAIDTTKLAEAWQALHPRDVVKAASIAGAGRSARNAGEESGRHPGSIPGPHPHLSKAVPPELSAFLQAAREAILRALRAVLPKAWTEGWVLGQQAAKTVIATPPPSGTISYDFGDVDWDGWTPGDYAAAEAIAGPGLRQLLAEQDIRIRSIAESRLEELSAVLEETLASDETTRDLDGPVPVTLSVQGLADRLKDVLDNPSNAELVAQAEIGRAQAEAARRQYAEGGITEIEISTAEDDKVCPVCDAAAEAGPHPVGTAPMVLLHPRCRCAELPVLATAVA